MNVAECSSHSSRPSLCFFHQNIQGIGNKFDVVENSIYETHPDIFVLTEHQKSNSDLHLFKFEGYLLIASYCRGEHKGGGVAIYAKLSLCDFISRVNWTENLSEDMHFESAMIKITLGTFIFFVLGIYRSPNGSYDKFSDSLEIILNKVHRYRPNNDKVNVCCLGDFNIDTLNNNKDKDMFVDLVQSYGLTDTLGHVPTRVTFEHQSSIDHIITDFDFIEASVVNNFVSDHYAQIIDFDVKEVVIDRPHNPQFYRRNFNCENVASLRFALGCESWDSVFCLNDVNDKWNAFFNLIKWHLDINCPVARVKKLKRGTYASTLSNGKVVLSDYALHLRASMRNMHNMYVSTGIEAYKINYRQSKNLFRKEVNKIKSEKINSRIMTSDNVAKSSWAFVNSIRCRDVNKANVNITLMENNKDVSDPITVSQMFNNYFVNIVKDDLPSQRHNEVLGDVDLSGVDMGVIPNVTSDLIIKIIDGLNNKLSSGWDNFSPNLLKKCKVELADILAHLINSVLVSGIFPDSLKFTIVRPLFKKGPKDNIQNYRPISLASTFSKVIEKIVLISLNEHFSSRGLLADFQHGFRRGRSTVSAAANFVHATLEKLDSGSKVAGLCLDLSKAFDRVNHDILLKKLHAYNVPVWLLKMIKSFLKGRIQCTEIFFDDGKDVREYRSDTCTVDCGVPQGSILGPFLYVCYVNDFPNVENVLTNMYADDTSGLCWAENLLSLMATITNFANVACKYFNDIDFKVNISKTELVSFGIGKYVPPVHIVFNDIDVESNNFCKFLGMYFDKNLTWSKHIEHVSAKLLSGIYLLRRLSGYLDCETLRTVYFGVFYPHFAYGLSLWGGTYHTYINRIFLLQKRAIRIVAKVDTRQSCRELFKNFKVLTLYGLYAYQTITMVKGDDKFTKRNRQIHEYNVRNKNDYYRIRRRFSRTVNSPYVKGAILYNKLPQFIKNLEGSKFKIGLKNWLIQKCPYSLDELC